VSKVLVSSLTAQGSDCCPIEECAECKSLTGNVLVLQDKESFDDRGDKIPPNCCILTENVMNKLSAWANNQLEKKTILAIDFT
jgi:hypothetical protein